jgi:hypothetical protein
MCVVVLFPLVFPQQNMYLGPSNIKMQEEKDEQKSKRAKENEKNVFILFLTDQAL